MKALRLTTFVVTLTLSLVISFWPPLLYKGDQPPSYRLTIIILISLCIGIVYGSGILNKLAFHWLILAALIAWSSVLTIAWIAVPVA